MADDRIRAKEPKKSRERWYVGQIKSVTEDNSRYQITVRDENEEYKLSVSSAIYDLFRGRLETEDTEKPIGETVYFIEKGD